MKLEVIPKQTSMPVPDAAAIQLQHVAMSGDKWEGSEITEEVVSKLLKQIPYGIEAYLSLVPYGEDDWMEVICDREWIALGYSSEGGRENYYSYNPAYAESEEWSPLVSGGQSQVEKYLALTDIEAGVQAVAYFIRAGKLYPGIYWARQLGGEHTT